MAPILGFLNGFVFAALLFERRCLFHGLVHLANETGFSIMKNLSLISRDLSLNLMICRSKTRLTT